MPPPYINYYYNNYVTSPVDRTRKTHPTMLWWSRPCALLSSLSFRRAPRTASGKGPACLTAVCVFANSDDDKNTRKKNHLITCKTGYMMTVLAGEWKTCNSDSIRRLTELMLFILRLFPWAGVGMATTQKNTWIQYRAHATVLIMGDALILFIYLKFKGKFVISTF